MAPTSVPSPLNARHRAAQASLHRMVYRSEAVDGSADRLVDLAEIFGASRRNNPPRALTGMLLAHDGCFLQALEGQRPHIDALMRELERDPRHRQIEVLSDTPCDRRLFGAWAMGQAIVTPAIAARLAYHGLKHLAAADAVALLHSCSQPSRPE